MTAVSDGTRTLERAANSHVAAARSARVIQSGTQVRYIRCPATGQTAKPDSAVTE